MSEESELERDLLDALRTKSPPAGFASRVMSRLPIEKREHFRPFTLRLLATRWVAAGLTLLVAGSASVTMYRHWQYLERGREANEQLMLALRITGSKLQAAEERVRSLGAESPRDSRLGETEQVP